MFKVIYSSAFNALGAIFFGTTLNASINFSTGGMFSKKGSVSLVDNIADLQIICGASSDEISIDMLLKSGERIVAVCDQDIYRILYIIYKGYK